MFYCDSCGLCCCNLNKSALYRDLDRGDGICYYFDLNTHLCTIYNNRPLKCNVDKTYELFFKDTMSREQYYKLNRDACDSLKREVTNVLKEIN